MGKVATPVTLKTFLPADTDIGGMTVGQYLARAGGRSDHDHQRAGLRPHDLRHGAAPRPDPDRRGHGQRRLRRAGGLRAARADRGRRAPALRTRRIRPLRRRLPALLAGAHHRRRHGGQSLPARRKTVGHRHRPARPRHQDGRPAALRPDHRRRPPRHGQDRARHQHRLQHRQGASRRSPGRRHHEIRQWRHRRLLLLRNVGRTARHAYSRRADQHRLEHDPPRRHHRGRFREDPRLLDRTAVAAALCRRNRRPVDLAAHRARPPAEAAKGPRHDRDRLHPAAAGLGQASPTTACRKSPRSPPA